MIDEARLDELRWSWDNETSVDDDWRDTLTADEAALVAAWDDAYAQGLARMVRDSRSRVPDADGREFYPALFFHLGDIGRLLLFLRCAVPWLLAYFRPKNGPKMNE